MIGVHGRHADEAVSRERMLDHLAVAGLEDVERCANAREEDDVREREESDLLAHRRRIPQRSAREGGDLTERHGPGRVPLGAWIRESRAR
jgi:hypothetical protein